MLLMSEQIYFYVIRIDDETYRCVVICALNYFISLKLITKLIDTSWFMR